MKVLYSGLMSYFVGYGTNNMEELTQREFLFKVMTEEKSYSDISGHYKVHGLQLSEWWDSGTELRAEINRAKQIYNNKKVNGSNVCFESMRRFVEWYLKHERSCHYCGIEEIKLKALFEDKGPFKTKRLRGKRLEVDRKNAASNEYSEDNCVLVCYLDVLKKKVDHGKTHCPEINCGSLQVVSSF